MKENNVENLFSTIAKLDETVRYAPSETSAQLKLRWVNANMVEMRLPSGKTFVTDPFYTDGNGVSFQLPYKISIDDFDSCDYIFLNHAHPDHYLNIKEFVDKFHPLIFVDSMYAAELSHTMGIELAYIFPVEVGHTYYFPEFRLDTYHGRHNALTGIGFGNYAYTEKLFGVKGTEPLDQYGSLFNTNFMLTLPNGYKIGFAAGIDNLNQAEAWRNSQPNLLLHQRMVYTTPEDYAQEVISLGGQLVLPIHHETAFAFNADMQKFTEEVNGLLAARSAACRMFNPKRMKWYTVQTGICEDVEEQ